MDLVVAHTIALLGVALLVAIAARRLRLPYTVGLAIAGVALAIAKVETGETLTHDFIFDIILPPLLFEAALSIHWRELKRDLAPVLVLSTLGVVVSAAVVAVGMTRLLGWPFGSALVFGALIAATDPVAVIAMFKDARVKGRLRLVVETESLFNDGVAAVMFALVLTWAQATTAGAPTAAETARALAVMTGGGLAVGLLCGAGGIAIAGRSFDHLVETGLTVVVAYGSFLIAERFRFSGVLATVAAGMLMGNRGLLREDPRWGFSPHGRTFIVAFWDFAAFVANSLIFLLIGSAVADIHFSTVGATGLAAAIALVLAGRLLTVYPLCLLFLWSRWAIPLGEQHVLWWGGLRGALALALALALPPDLPLRDEILVAAFGVVAFSVIAQGLTMPLLLRRLGFL